MPAMLATLLLAVLMLLGLPAASESELGVPKIQVIAPADIKEHMNGMGKNAFCFLAVVEKKSGKAKAYKKAVRNHFANATHFSFKFAIVELPKVPEGKSFILLVRPGLSEDNTANFEADNVWSEWVVAEWMKGQLFPLVGNGFTNQLKQKVVQQFSGKDGVIAVAVTEGERNETIKYLEPLAREHTRWIFTTVDRAHLSWFPSILVWKGAKEYKFNLPVEQESASADEIVKFLAEVKADKAEFTLQSEPEPEVAKDDDGVITLVGTTFDRYVMDPKKDVFVIFYEDDKAMNREGLTVFKELAQLSVKKGWDKKGLVIAKMNANRNECREEVVTSPKLVLYPAVPAGQKMKRKIHYKGMRQLPLVKGLVLESAKGLQDEEEDDEEDGKEKKAFGIDQKKKQKSAEL